MYSVGEKALASCNHICMDAMQDKQHSIGDKWAVIGFTGSLCTLCCLWAISEERGDALRIESACWRGLISSTNFRSNLKNLEQVAVE